MPLKQDIRRALNRLGWDVRRYPPQEDVFHAEILQARRQHLLRSQRITVVLDVGANIGQYAQEVRRGGYVGRIISFEPLSDAFAHLSHKSRRDSQWTALPLALGEEAGSGTINVSGHSASSSFLPISPRHTRTFPGTEYVATEQVSVGCLDALPAGLLTETDRIYLKIDVQGYEMSVLRGGRQVLAQIPLVEMEICLVPLYQGQPLPGEIMDEMNGLGYDLVSVEQGYAEPESGQVLWVNGIFLSRGHSL